MEAAVAEFEAIDSTDVKATLAGGEALSAALTQALDEKYPLAVNEPAAPEYAAKKTPTSRKRGKAARK